MQRNSYLAMIAGLCLSATAMAHNTAKQEIVPAAERERAAKQDMAGPKESRGVDAITPVGMVALDGEFEGMQGRVLRAREIVIAPGGVVAVHEHNARPGMAYILEGEIIEHRNDHNEPIVRRKGDAAFERTGMVHWWENRSTQQVRALVVDIVPAQ